ncbi:serum response factor-binding protein 1-like protein [Turdus rufiventris]|nr:serum response factor-binding protein 1-like protein [Turdus rufiventris]
MAPVLNLNNEVVKMRKDVKKARVLTIRRLTRHIGKLKSKKGSEDLKLKNQKRVERLIEEIHAMKDLAHGDVLKPACTHGCIGQIHSSVASIGMSMYRARKW